MATLGRYELRDRLGRGGFATVYRAWDPLLHREVALKALSLDWSEDEDVRRRFLAEAQTLAALRHPNIVTVYDVGETPERPYFTMELVEGQTLADRLADGRRVDLAEVVAFVAALADALDTLHAAGMVHRDVKAANVMLTPERGATRVVLMDLGIARQLAGPQFTSQSVMLLSPESAAPEQVAGRPVGPAADIYALGVVTYQMLAGRPPFVGDTAALLHAHVYEPPPPLWELRPGLPGTVYATVQEALAKDPSRRPQTAGAFAVGLQEAARSEHPATLPPAPAPAEEHRLQDTQPAPTRVQPRPAGASQAGAPVEPPVERTRPLSPAGTPTEGSGGARPETSSPAPAPSPAPPPHPPAGRGWSRRRLLAAGAGAVIVAAGTAAGVKLLGGTSGPQVTVFAGPARDDLSDFGFVDGPAKAARFDLPYGVAVDAAGNVYVADSANNRIRKITSDGGIVSTFAGDGSDGHADGPAATAKFAKPAAVAVDSAGNVYVAELGHIRKITPQGVVSTVAGSGVPGFRDGPAATAQFAGLHGVAVDAAGSIYVADQFNNRIRKVTSDGTVSTVAGTGAFTLQDRNAGAGYVDGPADQARFNYPVGVAVDASGNLYVADSDNKAIRKISPNGTVSTLAGSPTSDTFDAPYGVAVDGAGNVYVADLNRDRVYKVNSQGQVSTVAQVDAAGVALDQRGNLYVAEGTGHRISKIVLR